MDSAYIRNRCYNKNTRKTPYESFTCSKANLKCIFLAQLVFVMYKIKQNWILVVKKAFLPVVINKSSLPDLFYRNNGCKKS